MDLKDAATSAAIKGGTAAAQAVGNAALSVEATLTLNQASTTAAAIATLSKQLPGLIGRTVAEIAIEAQEVIGAVRKNPENLRITRSFFDYNLGKAKEVVEKRCDLAGKDAGTIAAVDKVVAEIRGSFQEFKKKCLDSDAQGAAIAAETLSRIMRNHI